MPLYTVSEACDRLTELGCKYTDKGLRKLMERGQLRFGRIGSVYVVTEDALNEFIRGGRPRRGRPPK